MITSKIHIKPHLAEYCYGKFSLCTTDPVRFPDNYDIYHTIWNLMTKRPVNCPADSGNLEIHLPNRRKQEEDRIGKDPVVYNYLGLRAAKIIERKVEVMMFSELHDKLDENKHFLGIDYIDTVYEFMKKYQVNSITEDALLKNYYRWREVVRRRKIRRNYKKNLTY
jgi:hypothetical protein